MNLTWQIIRRVELPKLIGRASNIFIKYPSPMIALILAIALVYFIYFIIMIKNFTTMPLDTTQAYKNITFVTAALASFFVIFSRNKFKDHSQMFFFLNSRVRPHQIVISGYTLLYIVYMLMITLMFAPFLFIFWYQGKVNSILDIVVLFFVLTFVFCLTCVVWIIANIFIKYLFSKSKDQFYLTTFLHCAILGCTLYMLINLLERYVGYSFFSFSLILIVLFLLIRWVLIRTSTTYLNNIFIQLNSEGSQSRKQSVHLQHKNSYYLNMKLEWLNYYRNKIFKEQSLIFIFLILVSFILYYTVSYMNFVAFHSYLINFGLKEIFIFFSLTIGISYRQYRNTNYLLNLEQSVYFIPRIVLVLLLNLVAHVAYVGISNILMGQSQANLITIGMLCSIVFITMLSMAIGFSININDSNKAIVIIVAIVFVNIYDFVMLHVFQSIVYIHLFNIFIAILLYLYINTIYVRKPFFK